MIYITVRQPPIYHQMTLEEFLFQVEKGPAVINENLANTRTYAVESISDRFLERLGTDVPRLIALLEQFNQSTEELRAKPRRELYREFHIPKKSGGLRKIDAPQPELMDALRRLKTIFEEEFHVLYHTSAFAYVRHRSTLDAVKRHQANESRWFAKYDLSNFFGSTTPDFILRMFSMIFPFSEVVRSERGREALRTAIELAILDGGLPQGTPISPLITNVMMIPIDYRLSNLFRDFNKQKFVYTRYADDFIISSRFDFDFRAVERQLCDVLAEFDAPFTIKSEKTRYGSSSGRNYNLGIMLTKENTLSVGAARKRQFKAMLHSFVMDTQNGRPWDIGDVQVLEGYRNYYRMVEKETIDAMVAHLGEKLHVNIPKMIKEQLRV